MDVLRMVFCIYWTCAFLNLCPNVNANGNQCMECKKKYKPCKVTHKFLKILSKADQGKLVPKTANDTANQHLDKCLHPGYKLTDTLNFTICSGSSDGMCHTIAPKTSDEYVISLYCKRCFRHCDCPELNKGNALREEAIIVTLCLAAYYFLRNYNLLA
ncbi:uncharacterized protein LOC26527964 [Drosophila mojavensis]|uniref:Uncharacterized protein, isoform B n=1 Tax=Drosophila mojavensis TaxID=7230 RepID=A0A0Q9X938_DROMO|nr:uncharacterized protein LOC26527964 [Drosophila mojavensis]KRG04950.1 uncharacterized protein Dmoj_GI26323, isoform B [Drosophila mojavensis]